VREEHSFGRDALPAGIRACVAKTEATETLLSAIIAVLGGDVALLAASPASLAAAARRAAGGSRPSSS
jgi:DNA-binding NarL/FixJ family response regulator